VTGPDTAAGEPDDDIPVLTDVVDDGATAALWRPDRLDIMGLETALIAEMREVAETVVRDACREIEAVLVERVCDRIKMELPGLIERILTEHIEDLRRSG
jgi:hypothetical protein